MFVNDRRDNWDELLPYVMHAYTVYSPFRLMMGEECSLHGMFLLLNLGLTGNMINRHTNLRFGSAMRWRSLMITFENHCIGLPPDVNGYTMLRL